MIPPLGDRMIFRRMDGVKENKLVPDIRRADPRFMKGFNHAAGNDRGSALLYGFRFEISVDLGMPKP